MAHIYQRGKYGNYWIRYYERKTPVAYALKTPDGKPVRTLKEALYLKREKENELARGDSVLPDSRRPVLDILNEYETAFQNVISQKQLKAEIAQLKRVFEACNIYTLAHFREERFAAFLDSRKKFGFSEKAAISDRTKNSYIITVGKFIRFAMNRDYLTRNPLRNIKQIKLPVNAPSWLPPNQEKNLLRYTSRHHPEYYRISMTGIHAGLRFNEIMNLRWENIEWGRWEPSGRTRRWINGSVMVENRIDFKTKNRTYRRIPLSRKLDRILKPHRKASGFLFFPDDNYRMNYRKHNLRFKKICRAAGVPLPAGKAFHLLRHTFGTKHGRAGRSDLKLSAWMGHRDPKTTKIYTHLAESDPEIDAVT